MCLGAESCLEITQSTKVPTNNHDSFRNFLDSINTGVLVARTHRVDVLSFVNYAGFPLLRIYIHDHLNPFNYFYFDMMRVKSRMNHKRPLFMDDMCSEGVIAAVGHFLGMMCAVVGYLFFVTIALSFWNAPMMLFCLNFSELVCSKT
jgi:hypothetical protein